MIKKVIINLYKSIIWIIKMISESYSYYTTPSKDRLVIDGWFDLHLDKIKHNNFGDDLNYYILKALTGKTLINYKFLIFKKRISPLMCIGSIINTFAKNNSIIWGSGINYDDRPFPINPKKILAVRGPKTREYLISHGVNCPEIYGDPALLLPHIYNPKEKTKKYKWGIIPHIIDYNTNCISQLLNYENCKVIDLKHYTNWHDIIDEICQCDAIISSSLHGLILADAYNVPNVWVEFSYNINGKRLKYYDYFASVNRDVKMPIYINTPEDILLCNDHISLYKSIDIDLTALINSAPFHIKL